MRPRSLAGGLPSPAALLPEDASFWQPPQSLADVSQPLAGPFMGQVAGVARGHNGSVWAFHRGDRVWDGATFTGPRFEHVTLTEPIRQATVLQLDQDTGERCRLQRIKSSKEWQQGSPVLAEGICPPRLSSCAEARRRIAPHRGRFGCEALRCGSCGDSLVSGARFSINAANGVRASL